VYAIRNLATTIHSDGPVSPGLTSQLALFKGVPSRPSPGVKPEIGQGGVGYDAAMSPHAIRSGVS
jgi:hypothetical protein